MTDGDNLFSVGDVVDGRYEIVQIISPGSVYLARDKVKDVDCSLKVYLANRHVPEEMLDTVLDYFRSIQQLNSRALIKVLDIVEHDHMSYIVREYVKGQLLSQCLNNGMLPAVESVVDWAMQLCDGLHELHMNAPSYLYGDIKPDNIFLTEDGSIGILESIFMGEDVFGDSPHPRIRMGTKGYAAPEVYDKEATIDVRADIYALGATMYYLLTGKNPSAPPYEIYSIRCWNPKLPKKLDKIVSKCTAIRPKDRYADFMKLKKALAGV